MREFLMAMSAVVFIGLFFSLVIYPDLEYTGGKGGHSCTGECYEEYVAMFGTPAEQEIRKRDLRRVQGLCFGKSVSNRLGPPSYTNDPFDIGTIG